MFGRLISHEGSEGMDAELRAALKLLIAKDDEGVLVDRWADEDHWRSEELEKALDVVRTRLDEA